MSSVALRDIIVAKINEGNRESFEEVLQEPAFRDCVRIVQAEIIGHARWHVICRAVYSVACSNETSDVQYFEVTYSVGATENQDLDTDDAEAHAVIPRTVVTTKYVKEGTE